MIDKELISKILGFVDSLLRSKLSENKKEKILKAFRSRARELPSIMFSNGLSYALVYIASRYGSIDTIEIGLRNDNYEKILEDLATKIEKISEEKLGYALYGALLVYLLKISGFTNANNFSDLVKQAMDDPVLERGALDISEWIKRLAEAYITTEE